MTVETSAPTFRITFADSARFEQSAGLCAAAGALAGVLAWQLAPSPGAAGPTVGATPLVSAAALAIALAFAASATQRASSKGRAGAYARAALPLACAGLFLFLLPRWLHDYPGFSAALTGVGLGAILLATPIEGARASLRAAALVASGAAALLGAWALRVLAASPGLSEALPDPVVAAGLGAGFGILVAVGTAPAHLGTAHDPLRSELERAFPQRSGELAELAHRAYASCAAAREAARQHERVASGALSDRLHAAGASAIALASRCRALDELVGHDTETAIAGRVAELERRAAQAEDSAARSHYGRARASLEAQAEQLRRIRRCRDRGIALLHEEIELLDRARLALAGSGGAGSERLPAELDVVAEALGRAAEVMEAETEAVTSLQPAGEHEKAVIQA